MTQTMVTYTVNGSGMFPLDMLRYDAAWPATAADATELEWAIAQPAERRDKGPKPIRLQSYQKPTKDRWSSFLWGVGDIN